MSGFEQVDWSKKNKRWTKETNVVFVHMTDQKKSPNPDFLSWNDTLIWTVTLNALPLWSDLFVKIVHTRIKTFWKCFLFRVVAKVFIFTQISRVELMGINATSRRFLTKPI